MLIMDKAKNIKIKDFKPQLYHGHTILEFKDVRTGSRERIESDNTFTMGIENHLKSAGIGVNSPWNNSTWRNQKLYRNLIGGIFLFDREIEPVDGVYPSIMPAGTKMVANGAFGVSNNSVVTEMGSFNEAESAFNENSLTFVYDWSTSQGNGDIACVCLTSEIGGYIGYGNSVSNVAHATRKGITDNQERNVFPDVDKLAYTAVGNTIYKVESKTDNVSILCTRQPLNVSEVSLFDVVTAYTVQFPAELTALGIQSGYWQVRAGAAGKFIFYPSQPYGLPAGTYSFKIGIYDVEDDSWEIIPITSSTSWSNFTILGATDNYIFFYCYSLNGDSGQHYYCLDTSDGNVEETDYGDYQDIGQVGENLFLMRDNSSYMHFVDDVNGTKYITNMTGYSFYNLISGEDNIFVNNEKYGSGNRNGLGIFRNPLYLATVNNLGEVRTKTSTKTMKVIYTITRAGEEEK